MPRVGDVPSSKLFRSKEIFCGPTILFVLSQSLPSQFHLNEKQSNRLVSYVRINDDENFINPWYVEGTSWEIPTILEVHMGFDVQGTAIPKGQEISLEEWLKLTQEMRESKPDVSWLLSVETDDDTHWIVVDCDRYGCSYKGNCLTKDIDLEQKSWKIFGSIYEISDSGREPSTLYREVISEEWRTKFQEAMGAMEDLAEDLNTDYELIVRELGRLKNSRELKPIWGEDVNHKIKNLLDLDPKRIIWSSNEDTIEYKIFNLFQFDEDKLGNIIDYYQRTYYMAQFIESIMHLDRLQQGHVEKLYQVIEKAHQQTEELNAKLEDASGVY